MKLFAHLPADPAKTEAVTMKTNGHPLRDDRLFLVREAGLEVHVFHSWYSNPSNPAKYK